MSSNSNQADSRVSSKKIPSEFIELLKHSTDIVALIEAKTGQTSKKCGDHFEMACCFHEENTPSLKIQPKTSGYHCFGCGASGDAIEFLKHYNKLEFRDAVRELAGFNGMQVPETVLSELDSVSHTVIRDIFKDAAQFYADNFNQDGDCLEYMYETRGFENLDFLKKQQIGATAKDRTLFSHLRGKYSISALEASTLIVRNERDEHYDFFGSHLGKRIIIPIRDRSGRTIAFTSRVFLESDEERVKSGGLGKYINTKEIPFFSKKSQLLDGIDLLPKKTGDILVVEGNIDRLTAVYYGYPTVAIGTSQISVEQITTLLRLTDYGIGGKIILCLDGDKAGESGSFKSVVTAFSQLHHGGALWVVTIPHDEGKKVDVDDVLRKQGKPVFDAILKNAVSATEFFRRSVVNQALQHGDATDPQFRQTIKRFAEQQLNQVATDYKQLILNYVIPELIYGNDEVESGDWQDQLIRKDQTKTQLAAGLEGKLLCNEFNILHILTHDPNWAGVLGFNTLKGSTFKLKKPPIKQFTESIDEWNDRDDFLTTTWINKHYRIYPQPHTVANAILSASLENSYSPVVDYLDGLKWDGTARLASMLKTYLFSGQNSQYLELAARVWLISAVARAFQPGCKVDTVPILEGMQGRGKSSAIKILCPNTEWYADSSFKIGERDGYTFLQGRWMIELAELKSVLGVDANTSKAFFSSAEDSYIAKYDKHSVTHKRQCIFVGTSNMEEYLRDETGNRRYLPIKCSSNGEWIDLKSLERDRDQLWAEATHLYRLGVKWYPDGEIEENLVLSEQHTRIETDPWDNLIVNFTEFRSEFTLDDLFQTLEIPKAQRSRRDQIRIGRILTRLGFEKIRKRDGDNRFNVYKKTD